MNYQPVDDRILDELRNIVGHAGVDVDPEKLENYGHDETPLYHVAPEAVIHPVNTTQIAAIVKICHDRSVPVTVRGGGTSLSGGAVPVYRGLVMALDRMNRIKEIDTDNLMVVVEPGVITADLDKELAREKLFFPPDPVSLESCTIGGNVAECAGGPRAMKYGVTRNYVTGLEVVLADGSVLRLGGKLLKNATGYDLINLFVGSEGTLGIVTEITLEVLPRPEIIVDLIMPFEQVGRAVEFTCEILRQGTAPAAVEYMDGPANRLVERFLERAVPFSRAGGTVIVELDGDDAQAVQRRYEKIGATALAAGVEDVLVGDNGPDREKIWEPRRKVGEALKAMTRIICREDLVVPKSRIAELIERLKMQAVDRGMVLYAFGHLGDGNIHTDLTVDNAGDNKSACAASNWPLDRARELRREIYQITVNLGGTITAEHGIGLVKKEFMPLALSPFALARMRQIKTMFDPGQILNPGKVFPE